ncbi:MAG: amino acid-binding protein [Candidatus Latescibacteria bacterium 4484_181]|nr:MAG: amino acid-binding protein [Candidatus Latescibacteria bacterium 4484_181]RKY68584.1 MAG: amino acid-binding protein [Candidatus Latescibacterota bacterium]RKY72896.1 MAG: amino acid-binding protein [Candidatus Latescibacterota bacterium]
MLVKQISVFLENRSGRLHEVSEVLKKADINIRALSLADTSDFGILRLIVDRPDMAQQVLKNSGFTISQTEVLAMEVEDRPGGLAQILAVCDSGGINVEYMYAFVEKSGRNAVVIFRVENPDRSIALLQKSGIRLLSADEVYAL